MPAGFLFPQRFGKHLRAAEQTEHIDLKDRFEILDADFEEILHTGDAGVVDQDIGAAETPAGLLQHLPEGFGIRHIAGTVQISDAARLQRRGGLLQGLFFQVADHDIRAALAERQGDAAAQAAGRAGHDRRSAIQTKLIHKFFLLNKPRRASRRRRTS